jgi:hypothetical protein
MSGRIETTCARVCEGPAASAPATIAGGNQKRFLPRNHFTDANLTTCGRNRLPVNGRAKMNLRQLEISSGAGLSLNNSERKIESSGQNIRSDTRMLSPG